MTTTFDLSHIDELRSLSKAVRVLHGAADSEVERWLIVGATARDLILRHAHGLPEGRRTQDLDVAIAIASWQTFEVLENRLVATGAKHDRQPRHRFRLFGWKIDLLPFGGVEQDGVIVWPPENDNAMSVAGFEEASLHAIEVLLPGNVTAFVASPPGLLILKLIAWKERHWDRPRHDAIDLRALLDSYSAAWNEDRLYNDADDLLQHFEYDNALAGASLIGRDAAAIANPSTLERIRATVEHELSNESLVLAGDMGGRPTDNIELLEALLIGLQDAAPSRR